jgi:two-component system response regulator AlgR
MKVLIADDEAPARERLKALLARCEPPPELVGEARDGREALRQCAVSKPDLVLLDIRMPGMDGMDCARGLSRLRDGPDVVFVTAYDDHALAAFEVAAVDYLLKPIRVERLQAALERAARRRSGQNGDTQDEWAPSPRSRLCIQGQGGMRLLDLDEVAYFYAEHKLTRVRTARENFLIPESLKILEAEYRSSFVRVHRSALVSIRWIERLERLQAGIMALKLRDLPERIEVSRRHLAALRERLRQQGAPDRLG